MGTVDKTILQTSKDALIINGGLNGPNEVPEFNFNPNDFVPFKTKNTNNFPGWQQPNGEATSQDQFFKKIEVMFVRQMDLFNNMMAMMQTLIAKLCPK